MARVRWTLLIARSDFNPADDWTVIVAMDGKCCALFVLDRYNDLLDLAKRLLARHPSDLFAWLLPCAVDANPARAAEAAGRLRALHPDLRSSHLRAMLFALRTDKHRAMAEEAIVRIGLPE